MVNCLTLDYTVLFKSRFACDDDLRAWKNRLFQKLGGLDPRDFLSGYERLIELKPSRMPEIPDLLWATLECQKGRVKLEKNFEESNRVALMPPKKDMPESVARENLGKIRFLLSKAMHRINTNVDGKERLLLLEEKIQQHERLLDISFPNRGKTYLNQQHKCSVGWCDNHGTMSSSTSGSSNWFCRGHMKQSG